MGYQCAVLGCNNGYDNIKKIQMHRFPWHSETLVDEWLKVIGRKNWYPSIHSRVCCDHFEENNYMSSSLKRLKPNAIPSCFLPVFKKCLCQQHGEEESDNCVKMSVSCTVRGCISRKEDGNGINFFRFPTKLQQREQWLKILNIPLLESTNNSYVCSKHFEQKYIKTNNGNQLLLPGAVPAKKSNVTCDKKTYNLVPIQPKPNFSPIFTTNQNILIKPLPIVVVPVQNNNPTILNLKPQINQNFFNLQTVQTQNILSNQTENNGISAISISKNTEEINEEEDEQNNSCDNEETSSVISINSDNEITQNSTKQDDSCYVLVEVDDKIDDSRNSQDDAKIVASGFDIRELINDAKIAINKRINMPTPTPPIRKVRTWRTNYVGDCVFEDMENPEIRKHHWTLALNEIQKLRSKVKALEQKTRRLQKRLNTAKSTIIQTKFGADNVQVEPDENVQVELDDVYINVQMESDD